MDDRLIFKKKKKSFSCCAIYPHYLCDLLVNQHIRHLYEYIIREIPFVFLKTEEWFLARWWKQICNISINDHIVVRVDWVGCWRSKVSLFYQFQWNEAESTILDRLTRESSQREGERKRERPRQKKTTKKQVHSMFLPYLVYLVLLILKADWLFENEANSDKIWSTRTKITERREDKYVLIFLIWISSPYSSIENETKKKIYIYIRKKMETVHLF